MNCHLKLLFVDCAFSAPVKTGTLINCAILINIFWSTIYFKRRYLREILCRHLILFPSKSKQRESSFEFFQIQIDVVQFCILWLVVWKTGYVHKFLNEIYIYISKFSKLSTIVCIKLYFLQWYVRFFRYFQTSLI